MRIGIQGFPFIFSTPLIKEVQVLIMAISFNLERGDSGSLKSQAGYVALQLVSGNHPICGEINVDSSPIGRHSSNKPLM